MLLNIVLFEPEIPPNTGNIMRLCANTGAQLHLIEPLGFKLQDKQLRRAGLDYHEWANVNVYPNYETYLTQVKPKRIFACSTHGKQLYTAINYQENDTLLFGPETRGLPPSIRNQQGENYIIRIPMTPQSRSLNLGNAVAVILYEAWRQLNFQGLI